MKETNRKKMRVKTVMATSLIIPALLVAPLATSANMIHPEASVDTQRSLQASTGISPLISIGTGFSDKFKNVSNDDGILSIQTKASALQIGFVTQAKTTLTIDPEIASEFFSTPDYKQYLSGSVDRLSGLGIGNSNISIQKLWDKKTGAVSGYDTAYYDKKTNGIVFKGNLSAVSAKQYQNIDFKIDLERWSKDTGRLVEREPYYNFKVQSGGADLGINWSWGAAESVLIGDSIPEDSWVENRVTPTTITSEDETTFTGTGLQPMTNEHDTNYFVTLEAKGKKYKNIQMDDKGNWSKTFDEPFADGTEVKAVVEGTETETNGNGIINTKVSAPNFYTVGEDATTWADWQIKAPTLSDAYDEETLISGRLPKQNRQNDRSYEVVVTVNGIEKQRQTISAEGGDLMAPLFDETLTKGDIINATIIGHEDGQSDKESTVVETVVQENKDGQESWENWQVVPTIMQDLTSEDTVVSGTIPTQNKFNGRSYDLEILVNDKLVIVEKGYTARGGEFETELPENLTLQPGDRVSTVVVGHEDGSEDKLSEATTVVVADASNHAEWEVASATINEVMDTDTTITGTIPEQDTMFGRTYAINLSLNGTIVQTETVDADSPYNIKLPAAQKLAVDDKVSVTVIGHQDNFDDVKSKETTTIVKDSSNWSGWQVEAPTLDDMTAASTTISGTIPAQNREFDRQYVLEITRNGEKIITKTITKDGSFSYDLPKDVTLAQADEITATVIGTQDGQETKKSDTTKTIVAAVPAAETTSEFKLGYWEKYGLVYEGTVANDDWDLTKPANIKKTVAVTNTQGEVVKTLTATNTDWYQSGVFNGYQFIVDNDTLGDLTAGNYTFTMTVSIDGVDKDSIRLELKKPMMRSGAYHDKYDDLESVVLKENKVSPFVSDNAPAIKIEKYADDAQLKMFNKYWNDSSELVFDGYVTGAQSFENLTKKLVIKDKTSAIVKTIDELKAAPNSWGVPTNIGDNHTFQAIVPADLANEKNYSYSMKVTDATGEDVYNFDLN